MYGLPPMPTIEDMPPPPPTVSEVHEYMLSSPSAFSEVLDSVVTRYKRYRTADPCSAEGVFISPESEVMLRAVNRAYYAFAPFSAEQRKKALAVWGIVKGHKEDYEAERAECDWGSAGTMAPVCAPGYTLTCTPALTIPESMAFTPSEGYGFIGPSWLAYNKMVPQDPQLTLEEDPPRLCLDMASEEKLQNQRKFSMYIGGPAVFIAGSKLKGPFGLFIMGLGVACTVWHATAHKKVKEITGV